MFERARERFKQLNPLNPERKERLPVRRRTARALYSTLEKKLTTDAKSNIVTERGTYVVFKYTGSSTDNDSFSVLRQPTHKGTRTIYYAVNKERQGNNIIIRKQEQTETDVDSAFGTDQEYPVTIAEDLVAATAANIIDSTKEAVTIATSSGLPYVSEAEIAQLVKDIKTGTLINL